MEADRAHLGRALTLAGRGWGRVHPNPMVGAVVVQGDDVVGEGFHAEYGAAHAEVAALRDAGEAARGATLYVTLEPCAHHGKTPPCTDAILAAGIRRVVFASADPDPVAGGGAAKLAKAGIVVVSGMRQDEERRLNAIFHNRHNGRAPWLALKLATSLDGRLDREAGVRTDVTGSQAQAEVHRLRAGFDAILVGATTARVDNPSLTARGVVVPRVPPARVVFDSKAGLPAGSIMLRDGVSPVWIVAGEDAPSDRVRDLTNAGARVLLVPAAEGGVSIDAALDGLAAEGIGSILCEGGGRLAASLLDARRVSRMYLFVAPRLFGSHGTPAFPGVATADGWHVAETRKVGRDGLIVIDRNGSE